MMEKKKIKIVQNFKKINFNQNFIFSALNLSFLSYLCLGIIKTPNNMFLWCDGIIGSLKSNIKKTPGSEFIKIFYRYKFSKILIAGNYSSKQIKYLRKKFKTKVEGFFIPNVSYVSVKKYLPKVDKNTLILITLPTPKQEILAYAISKKKINYKIICIGGGLSITTGEVKRCPKFLSNIGLEFIWRLRTDTIRRLQRLITTFFLFLFYFLTGKIGRIKLIKI